VVPAVLLRGREGTARAHYGPRLPSFDPLAHPGILAEAKIPLAGSGESELQRQLSARGEACSSLLERRGSCAFKGRARWSLRLAHLVG
jgi:hypothetical protein